MEDFDRAGARVTVAGFLGSLAGVGTALYKGHPMGRTVGMTALSCAMVASACFTGERLMATIMRNYTPEVEQEMSRGSFLMLTHASGGGVLGGSILGYLYIGKPLHGIIFFTPLMVGFGAADALFQDMVDEQRKLDTISPRWS